LTERKIDPPNAQRPLRLWPGIVLAILLILVKYIAPLIVPDALAITVMGGISISLLIMLWWLFFSRAPLWDRLGAVGLMIVATAAIRPFLHQSIAGAGMGMIYPILSIPILCLVLVACAVVSLHWANKSRRMLVVIAILVAACSWMLVRTEGLNNDGESDFAWRWTKSPEEELLSKSKDAWTSPLPMAAPSTEANWPGFRGRFRDSIVRDIQIKTDWSASPPVQLWRQPIGPGWSSFAVLGNLFYTQEQRGDDEMVSCYNLTNGASVWQHSEKTRFWESNAGAGPRGTPSISNSRVYAFGATGILTVLQAVDGKKIWSRNAAQDVGAKTPIWGFSSSPLVVDDKVIVAAANSLIAYDINSGNPRWTIPAGGDCYSSPHQFTIHGKTQILLQNEAGVIGVDPVDGKRLWAHSWSGQPIVQPTMTADGDLLISVSDRSGVRRITAAPGADAWTVQERWTSVSIKPYFNDSIVHKGFLYGFDGPALACIDVLDGRRQWKGGRYGRGQILLLADQDLLLVLSEKGDLALVNALPDQFKELARFPGIKGKTWNHPVLVNDVLLIRNAQEMAAFRLSRLGS
jgi:outer membrane protein assembly factor BamB